MSYSSVDVFDGVHYTPHNLIVNTFERVFLQVSRHLHGKTNYIQEEVRE